MDGFVDGVCGYMGRVDGYRECGVGHSRAIRRSADERGIAQLCSRTLQQASRKASTTDEQLTEALQSSKKRVGRVIGNGDFTEIVIEKVQDK